MHDRGCFVYVFNIYTLTFYEKSSKYYLKIYNLCVFVYNYKSCSNNTINSYNNEMYDIMNSCIEIPINIYYYDYHYNNKDV